MVHTKIRFWEELIPRGLIGVVVFFNLQCALIFLLNPEFYLKGYLLDGIGGQFAIQGMGILFIMWNVPYLVALLNPWKHHVSLFESIVMQAIGLLGESSLLIIHPEVPSPLNQNIIRFIIFDGCGLILLILSRYLTREIWKKQQFEGKSLGEFNGKTG